MFSCKAKDKILKVHESESIYFCWLLINLLLISTILRFIAITHEAQANSGLFVLVSFRTVSLMKLMRSGSRGCFIKDLSPL